MERDREFEDPSGELDCSDVNRMESTTHTCHGTLEMNKDSGYFGYHYYFGFTLDWQMLTESDKFHKRGPVLVMEICHIGNWSHYSLEGYTFCEIPTQPGFHEVTCQSWKPLQDAAFDAYNFFLGEFFGVFGLIFWGVFECFLCVFWIDLGFLEAFVVPFVDFWS